MGPDGGQIMKKLSADKLISDVRGSALKTGLFITMVLSIIVIFINIVYMNTQTSYEKEYISHAGEMRV